MAIFKLTSSLQFPSVSLAQPDGLLAIGGDLNPRRIVLAYQNGIFPWYNEGEPIQWWSPDPRFVLFPKKLKIQKSMRSMLANVDYTFKLNQNFERVISLCSTVPRTMQTGTWITSEMKNAYIELFNLKYGLSAECYYKDELCGGLYGVLLPGIFCGESMFSLKSNSSKYAFIHLVRYLIQMNVQIIDCQVYTSYMEQFGAEMISRNEYLKYISK